MKKRDLAIVIFAAGLISFTFYGPFLDNYFVWDDFWMLENYYKGNLKEFLFGFADLRIFGNLILWLNCNISELNPVGYSLISIGAHIANSAMLFLLIYSLSGNRLLSIFTAVIFAASAVGCDAIFWKDAFLTVTGVLFYLLILYLYSEGNRRENRAYHNTALIIFLLAMFNKEEIASAPFMIIFIEVLFFKDGATFYSKLNKVSPYFIVTTLYLLLSIIVSRVVLQQEQFESFLTFRPLHTLFSGFTSFFISPGGRLTWKDPYLYMISFLTIFYFLSIKDRKLFLLGTGWVFLTFLPQSLTGLTVYEPTYLFNSISRHLYLPSIGPALIFSATLLYLKERFSRKVFIVTAALFFTVFISLNYGRVNARGREWRENGKRNKYFLDTFKKNEPILQGNPSVYVINVSGGRAYLQRALRGIYKNPNIYWTDDPSKATHIYIYLNDSILDKHESIMKLVEYLTNRPIEPVLMLYDLKGWKKQKLEFMHAMSESLNADSEQHLALGKEYRRMEMWDHAETEFKSSLRTAPENIDPHYELGLVYMGKDEYGRAVKEFEVVANGESSHKVRMAKGLIEYIKREHVITVDAGSHR